MHCIISCVIEVFNTADWRDRKISLPVTDPNQSGLPLETTEEEKPTTHTHVHFNPDPNDSAVQVEFIAASSITSAGLLDDSLRASEAQSKFPYKSS